jgi:hypothetical protein
VAVVVVPFEVAAPAAIHFSSRWSITLPGASALAAWWSTVCWLSSLAISTLGFTAALAFFAEADEDEDEDEVRRASNTSTGPFWAAR